MADDRKKPTIKELEAILNDPAPQRIQLLPDGSICAVPDETAELVKQARAEVLAACVSECRRLFDEIWKKEHGESAKLNVIERLIPRLEKLQPAAADLEELLREARLDEAKWWHKDGYPYHTFATCLCLGCMRVKELEKARAI
jgi:hypothetical protein